MALSDLRSDQINEDELLRLIASQVPESNTYEYKAVPALSSDNEKREFLKDVSAFANSHGGHIVFGMVANSGIPTAIQAIGSDIDGLILAMESSIRDAIQPRILNVKAIPISLRAGGRALVLRIPQSQNAPHRVSYQGLNSISLATPLEHMKPALMNYEPSS